jgi:hypothetical protein
MRFLLLLTVLSVGLMAGVTEAQAYVMTGSGTVSCGSWSAHRREYDPGGKSTIGSQKSMDESAWVLGFLSGIGFIHTNGADPLDGVDADGVWAWIDNYCQAHPIENVGQAAAAFYSIHPHR